MHNQLVSGPDDGAGYGKGNDARHNPDSNDSEMDRQANDVFIHYAISLVESGVLGFRLRKHYYR